MGSKESFENVDNWVKQLDEYAKKQLPKVLCALKSDTTAEVSSDEGKQLAKANNMDFIEVSSKDGKNVDQAFHMLAKVIRAALGDEDD